MLLNSTEFSEKLESSLQSSGDTIIVLSSFLKLGALKWLLDNSKSLSIKVIARWRKHDLLCGASDFSCYKLCRDLNIPFGISLNLHGKVYCVDNQIFVGSANLTSRGMALSKNFNDEFGVGFNAGVGDQVKIKSYLQHVTWIDDKLATAMEAELSKPQDLDSISDEEWSLPIETKLTTSISHLWIHELLFTTPTELLKFDTENEHHLHDYELLGLNLDTLNRTSLVEALKRSNAYRWMRNILMEEESLSFGAVSSRLHNAILDDPLPYRQEVKVLVANLYAWFELLPKDFEISRPRHSQVIRKIN